MIKKIRYNCYSLRINRGGFMSRIYGREKKNKYGKKYGIWFVLLLFLLTFAVCFVIHMKTSTLNTSQVNADVNNNPSKSDSIKNDNKDKNQGTDSKNQGVPKKETSVSNPVAQCDNVGNDYLNDSLFIGDSLTLGLASYKKLNSANIFASKGMNISKISGEKLTAGVDVNYPGKTAIETVKEVKPKKIYIMLGSNGISWLSPDNMIDKYSKFLDEVMSADSSAEIYIVSIPPVTTKKESGDKNSGAIQNSSIDDYNSKLLKLADSKKVHFLDFNTSLKNNQGKMDDSYAASDGLHFKGTTYDKMLEYVLTHVAK